MCFVLSIIRSASAVLKPSISGICTSSKMTAMSLRDSANSRVLCPDAALNRKAVHVLQYRLNRQQFFRSIVHQ